MKKTTLLVLVKKLYRSWFLVLFTGLVFLSCAQDSIFYDLSNEVKPNAPRISGTPTNMVILDNKLFVGTYRGTKIHSFDGSGWSAIQAGGTTGGLAIDDTDPGGHYLYALVAPGGDPRGSTEIRKYDDTAGAWTADTFSAPDGYNIQTFYIAGGKIFAGAQSRSNYESYAVLYGDLSAPSLTVAKSGLSNLLCGAAVSLSNDIYLAITGSGIYNYSADPTLSNPTAASGAKLTGIKNVNGVITAVTSSGTIYTLENGASSFSSYGAGANFTGGMGVWNNYAPGVIVSPAAVTVAASTVQNGGFTMQFRAPVTGYSNQTVTWTLAGNNPALTTTLENGLLTVDPHETSTLTVEAVSGTAPTPNGPATVTIADSAMAGWITTNGNPWVGWTLTADISKLDTGGEDVSIQWERDDGPISGATTPTYTLTPDDGANPHTIWARVLRTSDGATIIETPPLSITAPPADLWKPQLLLLGIQDSGSSLSQGYRELVLDPNGYPTSAVKSPGSSSPTSVANQAKYDAALGIHATRFIMQMPNIPGGPLDYNAAVAANPNWRPLIFASTSQSGLFSYRNGEWNAEE